MRKVIYTDYIQKVLEEGDCALAAATVCTGCVQSVNMMEFVNLFALVKKESTL